MDKSILNRTIDISWLLPPVSRDSRDIQQVVQTENAEFQDTWSALRYIFGEQFIDSMEGYGLEQWEAIFDVMPKANDTARDRRSRILQLILGMRPYTRRSVQNMLNKLYGDGNVTLDVDNDTYTCWLDVSASTIYSANNIYNFVEPIIPKNLLIYIRNTKKVAESLHIGGACFFNPKIHVLANTDVQFEPISAKQSISGHISMAKHIHVYAGRGNY